MKLLLMCFYIFFDLINTNFAFLCIDGSKINLFAMGLSVRLISLFVDQSVCDEFGWCKDCSDQRNCSDFADMISCNDPNVIHCISAENLCNGRAECLNCFDERNCSDSKKFFCEDAPGCVDFKLNRTDIFHRNTPQFCDGKVDCNDGSDEKLIGFGFKCGSESNGNECIIPQEYLERYLNNTEVKLCDNNANQCFRIVNGINIFDNSKCWSCLEGTIIQRQQVCNGIFDCPDLSDECLCKRDGTENICKRIFGNPNCLLNEVSCPEREICLNEPQICDGTVNCFDEFDENHCLMKCEINVLHLF